MAFMESLRFTRNGLIFDIESGAEYRITVWCCGLGESFSNAGAAAAYVAWLAKAAGGAP
jgi:hypothetical protein